MLGFELFRSNKVILYIKVGLTLSKFFVYIIVLDYNLLSSTAIGSRVKILFRLFNPYFLEYMEFIYDC